MHYDQSLPLISAVSILDGPTPSVLIAATVTTTVPVNISSGSNGAVNVSIVVELFTILIVSL